MTQILPEALKYRDNDQDFQDVKMARPVPVVDLWESKEYLDRLENVADRLESVLEQFILLFKEARIQGFEAIIHELLKSKGR